MCRSCLEKVRLIRSQAGISYTLVGDYYIPDLKLPEESRPGQYNELLLSGKLWTYLADLNEQADDRLACIYVVAGLTLYIWLRTKGCDRFAEL